MPSPDMRRLRGESFGGGRIYPGGPTVLLGTTPFQSVSLERHPSFWLIGPAASERSGGFPINDRTANPSESVAEVWL